MSKCDLFKRLKDQFNMERLERLRARGIKRGHEETLEEEEECSTQYWEGSGNSGRRRPRRGKRGKPQKAPRKTCKRKTSPRRLIDPIMLTEMPPKAATYVFKRPNGTEVVYNLSTLMDYCIATGNFLEPETRIEFSDEELQRMDALAGEARLHKESILEAKRDPRRYDEAHFRIDAVHGLERCAGELVVEMLSVVEGDDPEEGQMKLVMYLFPSFADFYSQLHAADEHFAAMCMEHFTNFIKGPPNKPTVDECGFLPIILHFFERVKSGEQTDFGF